MFSFLPWVSENVPEWKSHDMLYTNTWVGWVCGAFCWSRWTQNICLVWTVLMCVEILVRAFYLLSYKFNTKLETWLCHGMFIIARLLKVIVHDWEEMKWRSHVPYCVRNWFNSPSHSMKHVQVPSFSPFFHFFIDFNFPCLSNLPIHQAPPVKSARQHILSRSLWGTACHPHPHVPFQFWFFL